jgi:hypothetical protein
MIGCLFDHDWGWPRKRGDRHVQTCVTCGSERVSKVPFDGPHYVRTQDALPDLTAPGAAQSARTAAAGA